MAAYFTPSGEKKTMDDAILEAYRRAEERFSKPSGMRSEEVLTVEDFFTLAESIPDDDDYTHLMASKGSEDCMGFVNMWTGIFHTTKEEAQRVARLVGLEPLTPEQTAMIEDKILKTLAKGSKGGQQR